MIGEFDMTIVGDGVPEDTVRGVQFLYIKGPKSVTIRSKAGGELRPSVGVVGIYVTDADARNLAHDIQRELRRKRRQ